MAGDQLLVEEGLAGSALGADIGPAMAAPMVMAGPERLWRRAAAWLLLLGPFFFLSYGFANWWTAQLPDVGVLAFDWERHIPFLAWTIVPYMSIDLFYAASLFLCRQREELDRHALRLLTATAISVVGFLLFPLQCSFVRPEVEGVFGWLFAVLTGFDKPFNQAPSLHISLLLLLWVVYARHTRGLLRLALHGWFLLIGLSIFTTYQHHVIDGVTGAIVGVLCLYCFSDKASIPRTISRTQTREKSTVSIKLALAYLLGAGVCAGLGMAIGAWAWLLLWPAMALALVAIAYLGAGVSLFQKQAGKTSWPARLLLAPYQAGAWLSSRWLTRADTGNQEVVPGIWIGRMPNCAAWPRLPKDMSVLDLTAEFPACAAARERHYRNVPMLDLVLPTRAQLHAAVTALETLSAQGPVLVHCALGYSRSALVIAAWLLVRNKARTGDDAIDMVRVARPRIVLAPRSVALLQELQLG